jgi:hypothetical protein
MCPALTSTFASGAALAALAGVIAGPFSASSGIDVEILIPRLSSSSSAAWEPWGPSVVSGGRILWQGLFAGDCHVLIYLTMIVILLARPAACSANRSLRVSRERAPNAAASTGAALGICCARLPCRTATASHYRSVS